MDGEKNKNNSIFDVLKEKKQQSDIPKDLKDKCEKIIHSAVVATGGVGMGMAQIPVVEYTIIVPIQISMIIALGNVFNQSITKSVATAILESVMAGIGGRAVVRIFGGYIPVFGNVLSMTTAAGITKKVGWMTALHFYEQSIKQSEQDKDDRVEEIIADDNVWVDKEIEEKVEEFLSGLKEYKGNEDEVRELLRELEERVVSSEDENPFWSKYLTKLNAWYMEQEE